MLATSGMDRWRGKVAVVTGASSGIGLAIARGLIKHGIQTIALNRRTHLVEAVKSELSEAESSLLHSYKCDVSSESDVNAAFEWIQNNFNTIHIVVNNAGIFTDGLTLLEGEIEKIKHTLDVNVMGVVHVTRAAFKLMKKTNIKDGHVININSIFGHVFLSHDRNGLPLRGNIYAASKHALTICSKTAQHDFLENNMNIKVSNLSPGLTKTEILDEDGAKGGEYLFMNAPSMEAESVAEAAMFILSTPPHVNIPQLTIQPLGEWFNP